MTAEEIAVTLGEHGQRLKVSEHRIKDLEEEQKQIYELTASVKELAISVKNMVEEQKEQGERIKRLEEEPVDNVRLMKRTALTSAVSVIIGALITGIIVMLANYI